MLRLKIIKDRENRITLRISLWERIGFLFLAALFGYMFISMGGFNLPAFIVFLLCLGAAVYTEYWVFDREREKVTYRIGVFPFLKKREYPFKDLEAFHLRFSHRMPGGESGETVLAKTNLHLPSFFQKGYVALYLIAGGKKVLIQNLHYSKTKEMEELGSGLSDLCGCPLTHE